METSLTPHEFLETIENLLRIISKKRGVSFKPRALYEPLRETMFTRRKSKYFPSGLDELPAQVMPRDLYDGVRAALANARDGTLEPCISAEELDQLDAAYSAYNRGCLRNSDKTPKRWFILTQGKSKSDFSTSDLFMNFMYDNFYKHMLSGEHVECDRNMQAILTAFMRRDSLLPTGDAVRRKQESLLLACAHFCLYRMGDARTFGIAERARKLLRESDCPILQGLLLTHGHFTEFVPRYSSQGILRVSSGSFGAWGSTFNGGSEFVRAADVAIMMGFDWEARPEFLHGRSVRDTARTGINMYEEIGRVVEARMCRTTLLYGEAKFGDPETVFEEAEKIRLETGNAVIPKLEIELLLAEATAYRIMSRDFEKNFLRVARDKLNAAKVIHTKYPTINIGKPTAIMIREINKVTIDKLGAPSQFLI